MLAKVYYNDGGDLVSEVDVAYEDVWNMDCTLAKVIYPMLVKLKETKTGSGLVDDCDVPHLPKVDRTPQLDLFGCDKHQEMLDDAVHARWGWVLDQMLFSFHAITTDAEAALLEQGYRYSSSEYIEFAQKVRRGFELFGKYYQNLWD